MKLSISNIQVVVTVKNCTNNGKANLFSGYKMVV